MDSMGSLPCGPKTCKTGCKGWVPCPIGQNAKVGGFMVTGCHLSLLPGIKMAGLVWYWPVRMQTP